MIWKILFTIYLLIMLGLNFTGLGAQTVSVIPLPEAVSNTCVEIVLVFALIYTFALGWKKRLVSEKIHKWILYFSVVSFVGVGFMLYRQIYTPMYSDLIIDAMKRGMVPRNWDFQMLLNMTRIEVVILVLLILFLIFVPFYLGYYHYSKRMNLLNTTKYSGRKCFVAYCLASIGLAFSSIFLGVTGNVMNFNIFDCFSILSSAYMALGLYGYAFNQEILSQTFWRITLPVCVVIELLPLSFFSLDFKNAVGLGITQASPIYVISSYLMTAVVIFMLYRYAFTDVVFARDNEQETI